MSYHVHDIDAYPSMAPAPPAAAAHNAWQSLCDDGRCCHSSLPLDHIHPDEGLLQVDAKTAECWLDGIIIEKYKSVNLQISSTRIWFVDQEFWVDSEYCWFITMITTASANSSTNSTNEELSSKTAYPSGVHITCLFLIFFSLKSMNRLDFIAEKLIKKFFYEIIFGEKVEPNY